MNRLKRQLKVRQKVQEGRSRIQRCVIMLSSILILLILTGSLSSCTKNIDALSGRERQKVCQRTEVNILMNKFVVFCSTICGMWINRGRRRQAGAAQAERTSTESGTGRARARTKTGPMDRRANGRNCHPKMPI